MTSQPGWHPDPLPAQPGQPPQLRYWDGTRWTEHTAPAAPQQYAPPAYQGTYGAPRPQAAGYAYAAKPPATTPDGVPLAGWWQRAAALLIDWVIVTAIVLVIALPWIRDIWHAYRDALDDLMNDSGSGTTSTTASQLQDDVAGPAAIIGVITLAVEFCYHVGFLMWRQATPGKLVIGLRVRLRERPGRLPLGTVLLRWLGQFGIRVIGLVPFLGSVTGLYLLLDYLWPVWDDKKQAIHDKVAKTNVVRVR
ncbi:MAG TPA: RDD family protein [Nocardioides sp.]|uniref:RDD family protein n=1 Tax=Nocardioides sp. TaxID=35761 RepID=UPI002E2EB229|nr:RDD family protein [Nocardioides sp.]HEX5090003.1 RDD family protein [Nocardioides sp.]